MDVLVFGGTQFVGRYLTGELFDRGHDVTLYNRGETNPDLFPEADHVRGDRTVAADLQRLGDGPWDVVVDAIAYDPDHVRQSTDYLVDRADWYVLISSVAAYEPRTEPGIEEDAPVQTDPPGEGDREVEWWHTEYARNKVACEEIVRETFGEDGTLVIRPGMLFGPHDPVGYFTHWVGRLRHGGDVLVPDARDQPVQLLDARDLGTFVAELVDRDVRETVTAVGPAESLTFGEIVETVRDAVPGDATLHWVPEEWLLEQDVTPAFEQLPFWLPDPEVTGYCGMSDARARSYGLTTRPFAETVADVVAWYERVHGSRPEWTPRDGALDRDREHELLSAHRDT